MMINNLQSSLNLAILRVLSKAGGPIGCGSLHLVLRRRGFRVSAPTIGRRLRELEVQGLLRKSGVEGRLLTDEGRRALGEWEHEAQIEGQGRSFLHLVRSAETKNILDLLDARQRIEREIAALAAERASEQDCRQLEQIIQRQRAVVEAGELGIEADIAFHEEIGRISGNEVLRSIVTILRGNQHYNYLVTMMRRTVGSRLIVDHSRLADAIKRHDRRLAWDAMDDHLRALAADVKRYSGRRRRVSRPTERAGARRDHGR